MLVNLGKGISPIAPLKPQLFSPISVNGLAAWYDAADSSTLSVSAGNISQWEDKSGHLRHVSQSTGSRQPAHDTQNNLVAFNADQYLFSAQLNFNLQNLTFFTVGKVRGISAWGNYVFTQGPDGTFWGLRWNGDAANLKPGFKILGNNNAFSQAVMLDTDYLIAGRFDNSADTTEGYVNGVRYLNNISAAGNPGSNNQFFIGQNNQGLDVHEILIFDRALSDQEINKIGLYLADKWGVSWANI